MHGVAFCPLLKISLGNPYLKIFELSKLFVTDVFMKKKKSKNIVLLRPSQSALKYGSENLPCMRGLILSLSLFLRFASNLVLWPVCPCLIICRVSATDGFSIFLRFSIFFLDLIVQTVCSCFNISQLHSGSDCCLP